MSARYIYSQAPVCNIKVSHLCVYTSGYETCNVDTKFQLQAFRLCVTRAQYSRVYRTATDLQLQTPIVLSTH